MCARIDNRNARSGKSAPAILPKSIDHEPERPLAWQICRARIDRIDARMGDMDGHGENGAPFAPATL